MGYWISIVEALRCLDDSNFFIFKEANSAGEKVFCRDKIGIKNYN